MHMHARLLFGVAVALLSVVGRSSGQKVLPPGPLTGKVGGNVTFKTTVAPGPAFAAITWSFTSSTGPIRSVISYVPGFVIPGPGYEGRVHLDNATGSLELRELTLGDSGDYNVALTSTAGALVGEAKLEVYEPVSNVRMRANATDLEESNDSVQLTCSASGSSLFYRWLNGSSDITANKRVHLSDGNRTLTISGVLRFDRAPLYCTVFNAISNGTSEPVLLNISFGPDNVMVTVDPPKEFHTPGTNLTLSCTAQSNPPAEFKWAYNGTMLNTEGPKLTLENIHGNQSGNYSCWAYNSVTNRSESSEALLILVIETISGANITGPTEVLIAGKSAATLSCQAATGADISRKWLKDGHPLSASDRITFSMDKSSVSINPVQGIDNGQYQCILSNPVSKVTANYSLTVNYGPEDVVILGHGEIEAGHAVLLTCSASSVPPATFTWMFNGKETGVITEVYTVRNASINNGGSYTCVAKNSVTGLNVSSAPHLLTVKEPSSRSQLGAILGGTFGALGCAAILAGGAYVYMKKSKRSNSSLIGNDHNSSNNQAKGGEAELTYADVTAFHKADGSKIQLGPADAQVTAEPDAVTVDTQESQYSEVKKN